MMWVLIVAGGWLAGSWCLAVTLGRAIAHHAAERVPGQRRAV